MSSPVCSGQAEPRPDHRAVRRSAGPFWSPSPALNGEAAALLRPLWFKGQVAARLADAAQRHTPLPRCGSPPPNNCSVGLTATRHRSCIVDFLWSPVFRFFVFAKAAVLTNCKFFFLRLFEIVCSCCQQGSGSASALIQCCCRCCCCSRPPDLLQCSPSTQLSCTVGSSTLDLLAARQPADT